MVRVDAVFARASLAVRSESGAADLNRITSANALVAGTIMKSYLLRKFTPASSSSASRQRTAAEAVWRSSLHESAMLDHRSGF
jgi:hypothetical protein